MTKSLSHAISLGVTCGAAALSAPEVFDLADTIFSKESAGWLIEPWYYTDFLWKVCLIFFVSDVARRIALRRILLLRAGIVIALLCAAWANWHFWFIPTYVMLIVGIAILLSYCATILRDLKTIARDTKENQTPNQSLQPTGASARG